MMKDEQNRTLYRFRNSHYSEKVRWAIEFKGLRYVRKEVMMGLGQGKLERTTGFRQVPVFKDDTGQFVGDSTEILKYLERRYPSPRLWPTDDEGKARTDEIETWADEKVGTGVRSYLISQASSDPRIGALWRAVISFAGPRAYKRHGADYMGYPTPAAAAEDFPKVIAKITDFLGPRSYLVGDAFTAADLTVCALLAPVYTPPNSSLKFPWSSEKPALASDPEFRRVFEWIDFIYNEHRHAPPGRST